MQRRGAVLDATMEATKKLVSQLGEANVKRDKTIKAMNKLQGVWENEYVFLNYFSFKRKNI